MTLSYIRLKKLQLTSCIQDKGNRASLCCLPDGRRSLGTMRTLNKAFILLAGLSCSLFFQKGFAKNRIIYGVDDRTETYQTSKRIQKLAGSTAGMIENKKIYAVKKHFMLPPKDLGSEYGLCEQERFKDQSSAVICSGFLIGPDLLVTAGHCIKTQARCDAVSWVFDYKIQAKTGKADILIPSKNVYKCKKLIESKLTGSGQYKQDYSVVQLDRVVEGREPLKYRLQGDSKVANGTELLVIGHPSGLPQKVTLNGKIFNNSSNHFFRTNLDTFGGNSGSAVFNRQTGVVEGILVRGSKDYINTNCGRAVNIVPEDITKRSDLGEFVSRITDVPSLYFRQSFLKAASEGKLSQLKVYASSEALMKMYDNNKNTPLHLAVKNRHYSVVEYLIEKKIQLDARNLNGETALHMAAVNADKKMASILIDAGADRSIKDNNGRTAKDRLRFFNFLLSEFF
ncbi:MAG: ankyrin repeat domain-containing protein [Bacteriovoracaceae bacterium]|jgi:V8-like Glu-specific endopeptidase|nr:hypothetical protein [Halobacteriovoraceae bacterium]MDP7322201.1 ankyrin repeat domain-containing protein [Bacteriovoracaceae bacterium]|tara:strand:+ start:231 stop:1592 length:1362 start_codon:yes stop_codon:yes gene_type:complete